MRKLTVLLTLLGLGAATVVFAPSAGAAPVVYGPVNATIVNGGTIPLTPTDFSPATTSLTGVNPFEIKQFNPADYQSQAPPHETVALYQVGLILNYDFKNTITMSFTNNSNITVNASGIMHLTLPDQVTDLVGTPTFGTSASSGPPTGQIPTSLNPVTVKMPTKDVSGTSAMGYGLSNPQMLAAFTGNSTINLPVFATATSNFTTTSGNGVGTSDTSASVSLSVVYYYTFVPEPSSMVLTGLGGVGLVLACRRGRLRRKE